MAELPGSSLLFVHLGLGERGLASTSRAPKILLTLSPFNIAQASLNWSLGPQISIRIHRKPGHSTTSCYSST